MSCLDLKPLITKDPLWAMGPLDTYVHQLLAFADRARERIHLCFPANAREGAKNPSILTLAFYCFKTVEDFIQKANGLLEDPTQKRTITAVQANLPHYLFDLFHSERPETYCPSKGAGKSLKWKERSHDVQDQMQSFCQMIKVPPDWVYTGDGACALNIYNNIIKNLNNNCWVWVDNTLRVVERFRLQNTYNSVRQTHCRELKKNKSKQGNEDNVEDLPKVAQQMFRNSVSKKRANKRARDAQAGEDLGIEKPAKKNRTSDGAEKESDKQC
jgi:hypothetical protein